ncbi:hypothetical protein [Marispirochaeta sp.]|uniref:hypothetical protein n=1 Tax=Marispirochaeta sp. TaxID=2038653 RepID=UPI0029C91B67|nr:hypothetical protein [Marispirochaeta sp.]
MKRISLVFLIAAALSAMVFAEGAQETPAPGRFAPAETSVLTGTISIQSFPPVLNADGQEYYVMVPPYAVDGIKISEGQEITLEGFVHQGYGRFAAPGSTVIAVTRATIDGTEYEIDRPGQGGRFAYGPCWDDRSYGPRGGRGGMWDDPRAPRGGRW